MVSTLGCHPRCPIASTLCAEHWCRDTNSTPQQRSHSKMGAAGSAGLRAPGLVFHCTSWAWLAQRRDELGQGREWREGGLLAGRPRKEAGHTAKSKNSFWGYAAPIWVTRSPWIRACEGEAWVIADTTAVTAACGEKRQSQRSLTAMLLSGTFPRRSVLQCCWGGGCRKGQKLPVFHLRHGSSEQNLRILRLWHVGSRVLIWQPN